MEPRWQTLQIGEPGLVGRRGVRIFFDLTRSIIGDVRIEGVDLHPPRLLFPGVELEWHEALPTPIDLDVLVAGEPLSHHPDSVHWLTSEGDRWPRELSESVRDHLDAAVRARRKYIRSIAKPTQDYLWFFFELDHSSFPPLISNGRPIEELSALERRRLDLIGTVGPVLLKRLLSRLDGDRFPNHGAECPEFLRELSWLQLQFYAGCLGVGPGDRALAPRAFAEFASGRLSDPTGELTTWNCRPNSAQYLQFAEFSIACIQEDIDAEFWSTLLPVHVSTQRLYDRAFPKGPNGARPELPIHGNVDDGMIDSAVDQCESIDTTEALELHHDNVQAIY